MSTAADPRVAAAAIVAPHVQDHSRGTRRGPLPDESVTYLCNACDMDWPCDTVLVGRWAAIMVNPTDYNAACDDREMFRRLLGEAQAEAAVSDSGSVMKDARRSA